MLDKLALVGGGPASLAEIVFERRQRADPACEFNQHPPRGGRQVHPGEPRPVYDQQTAADDEHDERGMRDDDEVSCGTKKRWQIRVLREIGNSPITKRGSRPAAAEIYGDATSTAASRCGDTFNEFVTRHVCSARISSRCACSTFAPTGTRRRARISNAVNCVTRSTRSTVPVASQASEVHGSLDILAIPRKVRMKQSATAATRSVSGDQRFPGPPNSVGGARETSVGSPRLSSVTSLATSAAAATA